jgi:DNA repair exonuclease SbcCD ATPase subunit
MEPIEINIFKLKDKIKKSKNRILSLNLQIRLDNEENSTIFNNLNEKLKEEKTECAKLEQELKVLETKDIKEKTEYKKSLIAVKNAINDFYKKSRTNTKLKRHIEEINEIMIKIDKYLC